VGVFFFIGVRDVRGAREGVFFFIGVRDVRGAREGIIFDRDRGEPQLGALIAGVFRRSVLCLQLRSIWRSRTVTGLTVEIARTSRRSPRCSPGMVLPCDDVGRGRSRRPDRRESRRPREGARPVSSNALPPVASSIGRPERRKPCLRRPHSKTAAPMVSAASADGAGSPVLLSRPLRN